MSRCVAARHIGGSVLAELGRNSTSPSRNWASLFAGGIPNPWLGVLSGALGRETLDASGAIDATNGTFDMLGAIYDQPRSLAMKRPAVVRDGVLSESVLAKTGGDSVIVYPCAAVLGLRVDRSFVDGCRRLELGGS